MEMLEQEGVIGMAGRERAWYQYKTVADGQRNPMRSIDEGRLPL